MPIKSPSYSPLPKYKGSGLNKLSKKVSKMNVHAELGRGRIRQDTQYIFERFKYDIRSGTIMMDKANREGFKGVLKRAKWVLGFGKARLAAEAADSFHKALWDAVQHTSNSAVTGKVDNFLDLTRGVTQRDLRAVNARLINAEDDIGTSGNSAKMADVMRQILKSPNNRNILNEVFKDLKLNPKHPGMVKYFVQRLPEVFGKKFRLKSPSFYGRGYLSAKDLPPDFMKDMKAAAKEIIENDDGKGNANVAKHLTERIAAQHKADTTASGFVRGMANNTGEGQENVYITQLAADVVAFTKQQDPIFDGLQTDTQRFAKAVKVVLHNATIGISQENKETIHENIMANQEAILNDLKKPTRSSDGLLDRLKNALEDLSVSPEKTAKNKKNEELRLMAKELVIQFAKRVMPNPNNADTRDFVAAMEKV